ncbi:MAG: ATP-binding protein [Bryobacteraceae bacterium]
MPLGRALRFLRSLRFRLALSYVVFFAVLLISLGVVFREVLKNNLEAQATGVLNEEWGAVKGYLRIDRNGRDWFFDHNDPDENYTVERLRRVYLLADVEGQPLEWSNIYRSLGFDSPAYIKAVIAASQPSLRIRASDRGEPFLIRSGVIYDERHRYRYFLAIGQSVAQSRVVLHDFTRKYFSLIPVVIALSGLLGWFMAGRALSPVNSVAEAAQRITHSNLDTHIPVRGAGDELDRLIEAFNRMMARLSFSFEQVRQFSTDVSHELRTPLTVVRGQLEVALFTAKTTEQYREAMVNALEDVERLSNIVRALLLLSQSETGQLVLQKTEVDLAYVLRDRIEEFQIPAEAQGVTLTAELPSSSTVIADRIQIERLLSNLLSNAIKYTPAGGSVRVILEEQGNQVKFIVEDTGVGISPDHLPHIFDRFYRVPSSDSEKGLGLGLSFVAWIVKAHEGNIEVESELHKGTRVIVYLPAAQPALAPAETPELTAHQ